LPVNHLVVARRCSNASNAENGSSDFGIERHGLVIVI
jgi:hypothetical protein